MTQSIPVITIDGPSGAGKGTLSRLLAKHLAWHFLDSGALYRLLALAAIESQVAVEDTQGLIALALQLQISFEPSENGLAIYLNSQEVSQLIRTEACGKAASCLAALPEVRAALLARQRAFCQWPGLIADGRDMGTVVFPEAKLKIFLSASIKERARRRYQQLKESGNNVRFDDILAEMQARDAQDSLRATSPLKPAADAIQIDTTELGIAEVLTKVLSLYQQRF